MRQTRRTAIGLAISGVAAGVMPQGVKGARSGGAAGAGEEPGWRYLFNGHDLTGWTFFQDGVGHNDLHGTVGIAGGVLHVLGPKYRGPAKAGMGYLATDRAYGDYHLSLEFKWGARRFEPRTLWKRDSGILYHAPLGQDFLWPDSIEFQIMERNTGDALPINHRAVQAVSLGGLPSWPENLPGPAAYAPQVDVGGALRQRILAEGAFDVLDDWNTVEVIAIGDKAAHLVNGRIVAALYDLQRRTPGGADYDRLVDGRILLQIEAAEIMFRNIRIRPITPE